MKPDGEVVTGQWGDCDRASNSCFLLRPPAANSNVLPPPAAPPARTSAIPPALPPTVDPEGPSSSSGFNPFLFFFNSPPLRQGPADLVENNDAPPPPADKEQPEVNVSQLKTYLTDPAWPKMWFLNRGDVDKSQPGMDMNVEDAWAQGYTGKNVTVTNSFSDSP